MSARPLSAPSAFVLLLAVLLTPAAGASASSAEPPSTAPAAPSHEVAAAAVAAQHAGEPGRAATLYRELLDRGVDSGALHYNLGNALLRSGELGGAIAAYRRARARLPRDADVAANLAFARARGRDALVPPEPSGVLGALLSSQRLLAWHELAWITAAVNLLFWGALGWCLGRRRRWPRWAAGALGALLLLLASSLLARTLAAPRVAVVVAPRVDVMSGTTPGSVVRFQLHAGSEVVWLERRGEWVRIGLPGRAAEGGGEQGWLPAPRVELAP